jgi:hypothetical protein
METNTMYNGAAGYYDPSYYYGYQPIMYNNVPVPLNQNALTDDEIKQIVGTKSKKIDLTIEPTEVLRECCTHKNKGKDVVVQTNDGRLYCPICGATWKAVDQTDTEYVEEAVNKVLDYFQTAKWLGDLPVEMTREYFPMAGLLKKFPSIYKYAMDNFNKMCSNNPYTNAQDASVYAMFDNLMGYSNPYAVPQMMAPQMMPNAYQQAGAPVPQMAPAYQPGVAPVPAPVGYQPQPGVAPMPQAPVASPMDISSYNGTYGVNPYAANQQFVAQAANMIPGGVPGVPGYQFAVPQAPAAAPTAPTAPVAAPTAAAPTAQAQAPAATVSSTDAVKV